MVPVNMECLSKHCASAYETCKIYPECSQLLTCLEKCFQEFDNDNSPMKTITQSCVNNCTFSLADKWYVVFSRCLTDNNCYSFPPIPGTCKYPEKVKISRNFNITDLKGGWWKVRGYNQAYDCLACQHTFFDPLEYDKTTFFYRPTFEVPATNGSSKLINGTIYVQLKDTAPGDVIEIDYYLYGLPVHLKWYTLDGAADNSSVLVYYCGNMSEWNFEGAMILSRSPILSPDADEQFASMVADNTPFNYNEFCTPQLSPCPN